MSMRFAWIFTLIILSAGCASRSIRENDRLSISQVESLKVDVTRDSEVVGKLGQPSTKIRSNSSETWKYVDSKNGDLRIELKFSESTRILKSILWVPRIEDPENDLRNVISRFPNLKSEPVDENKVNPHSPIEDITYRDESAGQVVLVNEVRSTVVALAWYSRHEREVTGSSESKKRRFSIGK
jgi:hypothetical protein